MDSDFLLIMKMKRGEEEAFERFIRKYYKELLNYCRYHCRDTGYAQDLTQETFLKFFTSLAEYHHLGKVKNYLYTIAGNLCKNFYKKKKDLPVERAFFEQEASSDRDPLEMAEDSLILEYAIHQLPQELREVVILHYFQDLKLMEVARILNIGLPLAKYRLRRAMELLRGLITER